MPRPMNASTRWLDATAFYAAWRGAPRQALPPPPSWSASLRSAVTLSLSPRRGFPEFAEMRDRVMERERGLIRSDGNRSSAHGGKATVRAAQVVAQASDRSSTPAGKTNSTMASDEKFYERVCGKHRTTGT